MSTTILAKADLKGAFTLNRNTVFATLLLTIFWMIIRENFTIFEAAAGIIFSVCCLFFCYRLLPFSKINKFNILKLIIYPFYLFMQIYLAGFNAIKLILTDADADIFEIKTRISSSFLRTILANSITLIPGSVSLDLENDTITVLWLKKKSGDTRDAEKDAHSIRDKLERLLS